MATKKVIVLSLLAAVAAAAGPAVSPRPDPAFRFFLPKMEGGTPEEDFARYPKTISATGFFSDLAAKTPDPAAYPFDINSALWSDGADKSRYLILPAGSVVTYVNDSDEYLFPEGAVFVKNFFFGGESGGASGRTFVETRIMVHQEGNWHGFSYKWRKDQSDADLVGSVAGTGEVDTFSVALPGGLARKKKWQYPARTGHSRGGTGSVDCNSCHLNRHMGRKRGILGFITPQLTRLANGKDQIQDMLERGYLVLKPGASHDPGRAHRWYALDDSLSPGSTLEKRARSYLASNCSHCHSIDGNAACVPIFSYNAPDAHVNYIDKPSMGRWGLAAPQGDTIKWIHPGKPEYSSLLRRISAADSEGYRDTSDWSSGMSDNPAWRSSAESGLREGGPLLKSSGGGGTGRIQMPPFSTYETNPLADRVIDAWIRAMPAGYSGASALGRVRAATGQARLANGFLHLPDQAGTPLRAYLTDIRGRSYPLMAARPGVFMLPAGLENGVFCVTAGNRRYHLPHFPSR